MAFATSSGCPSRRIGISAISLSVPGDSMAVSISPGEMALTPMPRGAKSAAISPGEIDTAILSPGTERLIADIPMRRLGQPEEVAKAIYFLCTEQSSYINGAELSIDGGQHV